MTVKAPPGCKSSQFCTAVASASLPPTRRLRFKTVKAGAGRAPEPVPHVTVVELKNAVAVLVTALETSTKRLERVMVPGAVEDEWVTWTTTVLAPEKGPVVSVIVVGETASPPPLAAAVGVSKAS